MQDGRDVWWHDIVDRQSDVCPPVAVDSEHMLYLLYTSGTTAKPKGIVHTTRGLPARRVVHPRDGVRREAGRRLLVRGRYRLGDRPLVHRVWAAGQRDDFSHVRGGARHARLGSLVADRRGLQGHDPVLRTDGHSRVHEAGRAIPGQARPVIAARHGQCRRADQSRGVAVVPAGTSAAARRRSSIRGGRPRRA